MPAVKIKITVAGRQYPLTVDAEEEEVLRDAGKQINHMVKELEDKYAVTDKQDALSMSVLQFASQLQKNKNADTNEDLYVKRRVTDLCAMIDNVLK